MAQSFVSTEQEQSLDLLGSSERERIVDGRLNMDDLAALVRGDLLALRWPDFYDPSACRIIADRLLSHPLRGCYENGPQIGRIGMAYFEIESEAARKRYYHQADASIIALRDACRPYANPIDMLRAVLDDLWPGGARRERIEAEKMFLGLVRIFETGSQARPHQDFLEWDAPVDCAAAKELMAQLTTNIYIQPATAGGELELWDFSLTRQKYEENKLPGTCVVDRAKLPPPTVILPRLGELIIFNANKLHAVSAIKAGSRITASCFIGVRGKSLPLGLFS
jgi:hypothetical protein